MGIAFAMPRDLRATRLPSNSRLPAVNIQAALHPPIEQGVYPQIQAYFANEKPAEPTKMSGELQNRYRFGEAGSISAPRTAFGRL
jgi:hypothetical protein